MNPCALFLPVVGDPPLASPCPHSTVLPEDFMTNGEAAPLEPQEEQKPNWVPWLAGGIAVGVGLLIAANMGGLLANPLMLRADAPSAKLWERAYREALRAGLSRSEAEEYALEEMRAYQEDMENMLGGALGEPETPFANPGYAAKVGFTKDMADPEQLRIGTKHELEHTSDRHVAEITALDHLAEDRNYYTHLSQMEARVKAEEAFGKWDWWRDPKPYAFDNPWTRKGEWVAPDGRKWSIQKSGHRRSDGVQFWAVWVDGELVDDAFTKQGNARTWVAHNWKTWGH